MTSSAPSKPARTRGPRKPAASTAIEQPPAHWRMSGKHPPAVWRMADVDEQQWRDMGCPTMGAALTRIVALQAQVRDLEGELLATPVPAIDHKLAARKARRAR